MWNMIRLAKVGDVWMLLLLWFTACSLDGPEAVGSELSFEIKL